jgi:HAD superfamily hydrolase (TIGR01484 family)
MAKPQPSLLLCFDFDGTLVSHESDPPFHPALGDMLREFKQRGAAIVINTGRGLQQTMAGLAQHNIFLTPDFVIARECEIFCPGFFKDWKDFGSWNKRARKAHDHFIEKHVDFLEDMRLFVKRETAAQFLMGDLGEIGVVATSDEELDFICERIEAKRQHATDMGYHRNGIYLRFSHADYSKGTSLRELARLLKLPSERIFAGGDNYNDLSMLDTSIAAHIACPSNALPSVKETVSAHGGYVASTPASEGMMEALQHFFLKK